MSNQQQELQSLAEALDDHSPEGMAILTSEPPSLIMHTILLLVGLMLAMLAWSFVGRADVIVSVTGLLGPSSEVRRLYAPIDGELINIFIAEGQPVAEGDVIARINARGAVQAAARSLEANLRLSDAQRELKRFPARKALMERQVVALEERVKIAQKRHDKRIADGMSKLAAAQQAKLQAARSEIVTTQRALDVARDELRKFEKLLSRTGGGGVSKQQVEERRSAFVNARERNTLAQARLGELEFELSKEYDEAKLALESSDQELIKLQIERDTLVDEILSEQDRLNVLLRSAELEAEAASRVTFDNIDEDNFLRILAPVTGVLTEVSFTQPGDKVPANTPLGGIAAADSQPVLKIEIPEKDRAFLQVGQQVKMKFNAFAYQRYGFIEGTLEYISPSTQSSETSASPAYKGRVTLEQDYFEVNSKRYPLRYGMAATAEIIVRKRRLIDLALDPFRNLAG